MGAVYEQFQREMAAWQRKYAARPRQEMIRLFLLALEREELVSIGYRENMILHRLGKMPIDEETRDLIHHAMVWAWKDEEMHSVYIRGAILRLGSKTLKARAFIHQIAGGLGGWSSSVRQHVRFREAPVAMTLATLATWVGSATGKVPPDVRRYLTYHPFREFCLFNIDAEKTAWACWTRLVELAREEPDLPNELVADFQRIVDDEERHSRVFQIFADALDEEDRLVTGESPDRIADKIAAVGEFFLPRKRRRSLEADNPLGRGGKVWVATGGSSEKKLCVFRQVLEDSGLKHHLHEKAHALGKRLSEMRVVIKPMFIFGYDRRDRSPITDPELVKALARYLREQGCEDIAVVEGRNLYDWYFHNRTVHEVARYFDVESPDYRIVDLAEERVSHAYMRGLGMHNVGRTWKEGEFRISFGKMRTHPCNVVYLSVANLEGVGSRYDEFVFAERQAHRETAIMMLLDAFPPHFALLDAYENVPDGMVGVMGCARPKNPRRIYASADALALDIVASRHMGLENPRQSSILCAAFHWFGEPAEPIHVVGDDTLIEGWRGPLHNEVSAFLTLLAYPVYEFASGRGALFLPEMDQRAFPLIETEGIRLRFQRNVLRAFLGLRLRR